MFATENKCIGVLLGKSCDVSGDRVIEQSNLDDIFLEDVLKCLERREHEDNFKQLIGTCKHAPQGTRSEPLIATEWIANSKNGGRGRGVPCKNSHRICCYICLKYNMPAHNVQSNLVRYVGKGSHFSKRCQVRGGNVIHD